MGGEKSFRRSKTGEKRKELGKGRYEGGGQCAVEEEMNKE